MEGRKVRLRLRFERRRMLPKPLRRDGLHRCWLLLHPGLATIADLSCYIFNTFQLHNACPNGIILSMEEFMLPSFESTGIFKDKDTISVRSTAGALKQFLGINDVQCCVCEHKSEEEALNHQQNKCSLFNGMLLLDAPLREVKTSKKKSLHEHVPCSSMRKKLKISGTPDQMLTPASAETYMDQNKCHTEERIADENVIGSTSEGKRLLPEREMLDHSGEKKVESIPTMTEHFHNENEALENNCHQGQKQTLICRQTSSKLTSQDPGKEKTYSSHGGEPCKAATVKKDELPTCSINFEDLYPLTRLPKEGDILVYRLFQSSPLLGPELSSFRVGKVASYDIVTTKIVLDPICGYPVLPKNVPYREDGSLEIDYPELVDVRLLNNNVETTQVSNLEPARKKGECAGWANNKDGQANGWSGKEGPENSWGRREGQQNFWGRIESQQNGLGRKEGPANGWVTNEGPQNDWASREGQENAWGATVGQQNVWASREGQEYAWNGNDGQENGRGAIEGQQNGWDAKEGQENGWGAWPRIKPRKTSRQDQVNKMCTTSQMPNYDGWSSQQTPRTSGSSSWASGQRGRGARGLLGSRGRDRGGRSGGRRGRGGRSYLGA